MPWSSALHPLMKYGTSTHRLAAAIGAEYEMQTIKLLKLKYGWHGAAAECNDLMMLARRILSVNMKSNGDDTELATDIRSLVQTERNRGPCIHFYCAYELARSGRIDRAISFLDTIDDEEQLRQCCSQILNIVANLLDREQSGSDDNLFELLRYVDERLGTMSTTTTTQTHQKFVSVNRMLILRKQFGIELRLAELNDAAALAVELQAGVQFVLGNFTGDRGSIVQQSWHSMQQLAEALNMDRLACLVHLLVQAGCLEFTCIMAKMVLQLYDVNATNWRHYVEMANALIVQQMHEYKQRK